ncbi:MAG: hypothetical protein HGA65_19740, partial [Oscillochloris sp.]|nr:hypothetical protein [Oscillochloris sp.]
MAHHAISARAMLGRILAIAERNPRQAVHLAQRMARRRPRDPWGQLGLGLAWLAWERPHTARKPLERARAVFARRSCLPGLLRCEYGLLQIDRFTFARPHIDQDLAKLADRAEASGERQLAALVRLNQARQLNVSGAPQAAAALLDQVAPIMRARGPTALARLRRIQAVAAHRQGRASEAVAILCELEQIFRRRGMLIEVARTLFERTAIVMRYDIAA